MKWQIDENYLIETDSYTFVLRMKKIGDINPNTGKPIVRTGEWYFPTINMCLKKYVQECVAMCDDAESILFMLETLNDRIERMSFPTLSQIKSERVLEEE